MGKAHKHKWRETLWTLEGPLKLLIECASCLKTTYFSPRKRLRKVPEGLVEERFHAYIDVAEEPLLLEAFRARLVTASPKQMEQAWIKGIVPPLPTLETLDDYWTRTRERQAA